MPDYGQPVENNLHWKSTLDFFKAPQDLTPPDDPEAVARGKPSYQPMPEVPDSSYGHDIGHAQDRRIAREEGLPVGPENTDPRVQEQAAAMHGEWFGGHENRKEGIPPKTPFTVTDKPFDPDEHMQNMERFQGMLNSVNSGKSKLTDDEMEKFRDLAFQWMEDQKAAYSGTKYHSSQDHAPENRALRNSSSIEKSLLKLMKADEPFVGPLPTNPAQSDPKIMEANQSREQRGVPPIKYAPDNKGGWAQQFEPPKDKPSLAFSKPQHGPGSEPRGIGTRMRDVAQNAMYATGIKNPARQPVEEQARVGRQASVVVGGREGGAGSREMKNVRQAGQVSPGGVIHYPRDTGQYLKSIENSILKLMKEEGQAERLRTHGDDKCHNCDAGSPGQLYTTSPEIPICLNCGSNNPNYKGAPLTSEEMTWSPDRKRRGVGPMELSLLEKSLLKLVKADLPGMTGRLTPEAAGNPPPEEKPRFRGTPRQLEPFSSEEPMTYRPMPGASGNLPMLPEEFAGSREESVPTAAERYEGITGQRPTAMPPEMVDAARKVSARQLAYEASPEGLREDPRMRTSVPRKPEEVGMYTGRKIARAAQERAAKEADPSLYHKASSIENSLLKLMKGGDTQELNAMDNPPKENKDSQALVADGDSKRPKSEVGTNDKMFKKAEENPHHPWQAGEGPEPQGSKRAEEMKRIYQQRQINRKIAPDEHPVGDVKVPPQEHIGDLETTTPGVKTTRPMKGWKFAEGPEGRAQMEAWWKENVDKKPETPLEESLFKLMKEGEVTPAKVGMPRQKALRPIENAFPTAQPKTPRGVAASTAPANNNLSAAELEARNQPDTQQEQTAKWTTQQLIGEGVNRFNQAYGSGKQDYMADRKRKDAWEAEYQGAQNVNAADQARQANQRTNTLPNIPEPVTQNTSQQQQQQQQQGPDPVKPIYSSTKK